MPMTAEKINFEKEPGVYNNPEIAEMEPPMVDMVKKMKAKIENGDYDCIISDDVSGRIPSLIFKKIIDTVTPEHRVNVLGLAAGRRYVRILEAMRGIGPLDKKINQEGAQRIYDYLQSVLRNKIKPKIKGKALVVSEYIHSGNSMIAIKETLQDAGIRFDIAALNGWLTEDLKEDDIEVYKGEAHLMSDNPFHKQAHVFAGIEKGEQYLPVAELYSKVVKQKGKEFTPEQEALSKEAYEYTEDEFEKYHDRDATPEQKAKIKVQRDERYLKVLSEIIEENKKISTEDLRQLREKIYQTREDINTMAKRIVEQVWPK